MSDSINFQFIGRVKSPFITKFGIPRQPGLTKNIHYTLQLQHTQENALAIRGLQEFSHLWVIFVFHSLKRDTWKPLVAPPRFKDSRKIGVLATRSPYRPNPIGQSVVKLKTINIDKDHINIVVSGGDFLDETPILDIKPYIPYADAIEEAHAAWAHPVQPSLKVRFSEDALSFLQETNNKHHQLGIEEALSYDPRPGYERGNRKRDGDFYHLSFESLDISWMVKDQVCVVHSIQLVAQNNSKYECHS